MIGMIANPKFVADDLSDATGGPNRPAKSKGFGTFEEQRDQLRVLIRRQQWARPRSRMVPQSRDPVQLGAGHPLADCALCDPQGVGDLPLRPPFLVQFPGPKATTFRPTSRWRRICCTHEPGVQQIPAHEY